ncbi:hypothetical protein ACH4FX_26640 [Streptomyces sp. NPDC018019]|uniref:hypothetical protein n=1 Tax=Streptomyces sp. NPDC018019 TaxID=3365030 RepID=UPI003798B4F6
MRRELVVAAAAAALALGFSAPAHAQDGVNTFNCLSVTPEDEGAIGRNCSNNFGHRGGYLKLPFEIKTSADTYACKRKAGGSFSGVHDYKAKAVRGYYCEKA